MKATRIAALAALLAGASVVMASPAFAEPLNGSYEATGTTGTGYSETWSWVFTPCGPNCVHVQKSSGGLDVDLHRQDNSWTGDSGGCTTTLDENSLTGTVACSLMATFPVRLVKVG